MKYSSQKGIKNKWNVYKSLFNSYLLSVAKF